MGGGGAEESVSDVHDHEVLGSEPEAATPQKDEGSTGIVEETPVVQPWRRQNLFLEIPSRNTEEPEDCVRINMPPTPSPTPTRVRCPVPPSPSSTRTKASPYSSSKGKPSFKNLLPKLSFKYRNSSPDIEKASMLAIGTPLGGQNEKTSIMRSMSLTKIFTPRIRRTSSLPVTPISHSNQEFLRGRTGDPLSSARSWTPRPFSRSLSVPGKARSIKRTDSLGGIFRVIPSTPRMTEGSGTTSDICTTEPAESNDADGEDIPEEEAICRICFVELCEGGETLKMECSCKGELALAHQECAIKWFTIKGNRVCDICKQEVQNLSVTLLRVQSVHIQHASRGRESMAQRYRVWQDVPILVIVSMLAYFCFLEQLLVGEMRTGAIAISLPFSCILGLLASMTSSTMVERRYVWAYATMQFLLVVLFAHVFYSLLHVQSVLTILLSTFAGFGMAMSGSSIFIEFLRCKRRWQEWSARRRASQQTPPVVQDTPAQVEVPPQTAGQPGHIQSETENPVTSQGS